MMIRVDSAHQSAVVGLQCIKYKNFPSDIDGLRRLEPSVKKNVGWASRTLKWSQQSSGETTAKLQVEYANANAFERLVSNALELTSRLSMETLLSDEMLKFDATQLSQTRSSKEKTVETEGPVAVVGLGNKRTVKGFWLTSQPKKSWRSQSDFQTMS